MKTPSANALKTKEREINMILKRIDQLESKNPLYARYREDADDRFFMTDSFKQLTEHQMWFGSFPAAEVNA